MNEKTKIEGLMLFGSSAILIPALAVIGAVSIGVIVERIAISILDKWIERDSKKAVREFCDKKGES